MSHQNSIPLSSSNPLSTSTPNHISSNLTSATTTSTMSNFTPSLKHPGLSLPPHPAPLTSVSLHQPMNHMDPIITSNAPVVPTPASSTSSVTSHPLAPPIVDSRQMTNEVPVRSESLAVVSSMASNGYPPPAVYTGSSYPTLYAPYAPTLQHSPYLPPSAASPRNTGDTVSTCTNNNCVRNHLFCMQVMSQLIISVIKTHSYTQNSVLPIL